MQEANIELLNDYVELDSLFTEVSQKPEFKRAFIIKGNLDKLDNSVEYNILNHVMLKELISRIIGQQALIKDIFLHLGVIKPKSILGRFNIKNEINKLKEKLEQSKGRTQDYNINKMIDYLNKSKSIKKEELWALQKGSSLLKEDYRSLVKLWKKYEKSILELKKIVGDRVERIPNKERYISIIRDLLKDYDYLDFEKFKDYKQISQSLKEVVLKLKNVKLIEKTQEFKKYFNSDNYKKLKQLVKRLDKYEEKYKEKNKEVNKMLKGKGLGYLTLLDNTTIRKLIYYKMLILTKNIITDRFLISFDSYSWVMDGINKIVLEQNELTKHLCKSL